MSDLISFGLWIKRRRKALDLTQDALAQRVGCAVVTIRKLEADERRPSREIAARLADVLELAAAERAAFIHAARAELSVDRLPPPTQTVIRGAFVPAQAAAPAVDPSPPPPPAPAIHLPIPPTALIGRASELAKITALIRQPTPRLVTLTGPGGIGKTRLGVEVAAASVADFTSGVVFVDLAPIHTPDLVLTAIANTLGVRGTSAEQLLVVIQTHLRDKQLLLVLDNFEQVLDAAPLVADLLASAAQLNVLVTSRAALHLRGEQEIVVEPLALPDPTQLPSLEQLAQYPAVALFLERARAVRPALELTQTNAAAIAAICARLDGLPLAIELAAARSKLFMPAELLARLDRRFAILTDGPRDLPARQQTIRQTIDWSYQLLSASEQTLFARLAVFVGGCTLEAAEAVCGDPAPDKTDVATPGVLDGLAALVNQSLVQQVETSGATTRVVLLETIREYALERLAASGETERMKRQHLAYYLALSEVTLDGQPAWGLANSQLASLDRLELEIDNLRAAQTWSHANDAVLAEWLRLTSALPWFWTVRGSSESERDMWLRQALARPDAAERAPHAWAKILLWWGNILVWHGDFGAGHAHMVASLQWFEALGDHLASAHVLYRLGWMAREQGDVATARLRYEASLARFRELGDNPGITGALVDLGEVALMQEDATAATASLEEARTLAQRLGHVEALGWATNHLGHVAQLEGAYDRAIQRYDESLAIFQTIGPGYGLAYTCGSIGECAVAQGDAARARAAFGQALSGYHHWQDEANLVWCLAGVGRLAALEQAPERAVRLWGAAERLRQTIGCRPAPATRRLDEQAQATVRAQLGEAAFAAAWTAGQALTAEQALAEAYLALGLDEAAFAADWMAGQG